MQRIICAESRTVELLAIVRYEHDTRVLEYHAQPLKLDLRLTDGGAKKTFRLLTTPQHPTSSFCARTVSPSTSGERQNACRGFRESTPVTPRMEVKRLFAPKSSSVLRTRYWRCVKQPPSLLGGTQHRHDVGARTRRTREGCSVRVQQRNQARLQHIPSTVRVE
jgi:hypothetical protein